jgi:hypothetical protein
LVNQERNFVSEKSNVLVTLPLGGFQVSSDRHPIPPTDRKDLFCLHTTLTKLFSHQSSTLRYHDPTWPPGRRSSFLTQKLCGNTLGPLTTHRSVHHRERSDSVDCAPLPLYIHFPATQRLVRECRFTRHRDTPIRDEPPDHETFSGVRVLP